VFQQIKEWEARTRSWYNTDLSTPENRRRNRIYNLWFDHEIIRTIWTNFHEIAPGVFRSNQPTRARLAKLKAQEVTTVLHLRGAGPTGHYLAEKSYCDEWGIALHAVGLNARGWVIRELMQDLIHQFRTLDKPFLMHCKSGADRAGFASAFYLMVIEGRPVSEARKQLSWRYGHIRNRHVGILDYVLDIYEDRATETGISFEDWISTEYDPEALTTRFRTR